MKRMGYEMNGSIMEWIDYVMDVSWKRWNMEWIHYRMDV